jgi:hypothetical protein
VAHTGPCGRAPRAREPAAWIRVRNAYAADVARSDPGPGDGRAEGARGRRPAGLDPSHPGGFGRRRRVAGVKPEGCRPRRGGTAVPRPPGVVALSGSTPATRGRSPTGGTVGGWGQTRRVQTPVRVTAEPRAPGVVALPGSTPATQAASAGGGGWLGSNPKGADPGAGGRPDRARPGSSPFLARPQPPRGPAPEALTQGSFRPNSSALPLSASSVRSHAVDAFRADPALRDAPDRGATRSIRER